MFEPANEGGATYTNHERLAFAARWTVSVLPILGILIVLDTLFFAGWTRSPTNGTLLIAFLALAAPLVGLAGWGAWVVRSTTPARIVIGPEGVTAEWGGSHGRRVQVAFRQIASVTDQSWFIDRTGRSIPLRFTPPELRYLSDGPPSHQRGRYSGFTGESFYISARNATRVRGAIDEWKRGQPVDPDPPLRFG